MKLTGCTAFIKALDGPWAVILDRAVPNTRLQVNEIIGRRDTATAGAGGRVLVAYLGAEALDRMLRSCRVTLDDRTDVDIDEYKRALERVREQGYAVDDEDMVPGVRVIAAPIRNNRGEVIASLSVAGSVVRLTSERMPEVIREVVHAANEVSAKLRALGVKRVIGRL
jgi:DNA-binding IclR family transcriptional regulator